MVRPLCSPRPTQEGFGEGKGRITTRYPQVCSLSSAVRRDRGDVVWGEIVDMLFVFVMLLSMEDLEDQFIS